ncbi:hypothetical protein F2Q69_00041106 [Brassica cretica]|uniref:Uncharacterized protein n=1 Tax=Brassica cretica TaxID=69181 RepID=A0A8S9NL80_BRACR|nr:hypothetical protein F2Q69_00041106 [Brassica cretica]
MFSGKTVSGVEWAQAFHTRRLHRRFLGDCDLEDATSSRQNRLIDTSASMISDLSTKAPLSTTRWRELGSASSPPSSSPVSLHREKS